MVLVLLLQATAAFGLIEYYFMKQNFNKQLLALAKTTKNPEELAFILRQHVVPQDGYTLHVRWDDIGKQLLSSGVIDKTKYEELFINEPVSKNSMKYLLTSSKEYMQINEENSHFMVNTLWGLGLINKSTILDDGDMQKNADGNVMNYASTGGWTLGSKPTSELYSSQNLISLTEQQQELVKKIASTIYRPCCSNSVAFPDCNHGMAVLGYIELAVKQGVSEKDIYKDTLALNSYWFPQEYVKLAALMNKKDIAWEKIDPKLALSDQYSSAQGAQQTQQQLQTVPGFQSQQGGCGA